MKAAAQEEYEAIIPVRKVEKDRKTIDGYSLYSDTV